MSKRDKDTVIVDLSEEIGLEINLLGPGPFVARSVSDKSEDWPFWMVCQSDGGRVNGLLNLLRFSSGQMFASRLACEAITDAANRKVGTA